MIGCAPGRASGTFGGPGDGQVRLDAVHKSYFKGRVRIPVLDDLTLSIPTGEFVGVFGPSGSGKTTLLNLLGGLDVADAGDVTVAGENLAWLDEEARTGWRRRHVGFVFQQHHLIPVLSAAENVELPLRLLGIPRRERRQRVAVALDVVGLTDRATHRPGQLSGGQEQRVAIARAVITDPTLLLADEPTGDLDRASAVPIMELLSLLNRELNKTVVMVTHDQHAAAFCSLEINLDNGFEGDAPRAGNRYGDRERSSRLPKIYIRPAAEAAAALASESLGVSIRR